jgi:hypothetical protein
VYREFTVAFCLGYDHPWADVAELADALDSKFHFWPFSRGFSGFQ